jgi:hypothetical protein
MKSASRWQEELMLAAKDIEKIKTNVVLESESSDYDDFSEFDAPSDDSLTLSQGQKEE